MKKHDAVCRAILLACLLSLAPAWKAQTKAPEKLPEFADYPVHERYKGKPARPRLVTPSQKQFRTRIRESMDQGVNFAGHYVVATWGCGTGCEQFAVTDAVSGRVYDSPVRGISYHFGSDADHGPQKYADMVNVKPDSALLVIEGCPELPHKETQCGRFYYHFDQGTFQFLHFDPDPPDQPSR